MRRLTRRWGQKAATSCWIAYLGRPDADGIPALAAITRTQDEAEVLLRPVLATHPGRTNLVEDRPFTRGQGTAATVPEDGVIVYVVCTGRGEDFEAEHVYADRADASRRRDALAAAGVGDAEVVAAPMNTFLMD